MKRTHTIKTLVLLFLILTAYILSTATASAVSVERDFISGYYIEGNVLLLDNSLLTEQGTLKPFEKFTPGEIATLYHELWHVWFIQVETPRKGAVWQAMYSRVNERYAGYPEEKRMEIYEEAVAAFIDAAVGSYMQIARFLETKTPPRREEIRSSTPYLQRTWVNLFNDTYTGYYTKNINLSTGTGDVITSHNLTLDASDLQFTVHDPGRILEPFVQSAEEYSLPTGYIREAVNALRKVVFVTTIHLNFSLTKAEVVFADEYLQPDDIEMITRTLFEDTLTSSPAETFAEQKFNR